MSKQLLEPILEDGIRNTNFFNGRLLTAEALRSEQEANRQQHQQLGQAIGEGVVYGLNVQKQAPPPTSPPSGIVAPMVRISAGLALNRKGSSLFLPDDTEVTLIRGTQTDIPETGFFTNCARATTSAVLTGTGVYILAMFPASGFEGRTPMVGLNTNGKAAACGARYAVEGVQFKLIGLDLNSLSGISQTTRNQLNDLMTKDDEASLSKLRNWLAHLCFGTEELASFPEDPFKRVSGKSPYMTYGAPDALRSFGSLTDCDVPLALIYWTTSGIQFIDMWSVRRRPIPQTPSAIWPVPMGERRLAEAEAVFLQFQEQLQDIIQTTTNQSELISIKAINHFHYLPSVGLLPISRGSAQGISIDNFFSEQPHRQPPMYPDLPLHQGYTC